MVASLLQVWQQSGFSVSWIFVFLSVGEHGGGGRRENYTMPIDISGIFFFSLSSSLTKNISQITGKPHSSLSPAFQTKKWTFLKLCRLLWVILPHCMSNFSETGHPPLPADAPSPCLVLSWIWSPEQLPPRLPYQQPPALPSALLPKLC